VSATSRSSLWCRSDSQDSVPACSAVTVLRIRDSPLRVGIGGIASVLVLLGDRRSVAAAILHGPKVYGV
jgi:hypothetical protein